MKTPLKQADSLRKKLRYIQSLLAAASIVVLVISAFSTPARAGADWRKDIGTFRIGLVAADNVEAVVARVEPFRLAIGEALGLNVEIFAARNYRALINAQAAARIEYAIYSASAYATAWQLCECVEPLVLPKTSDGATSYSSVVIALKDGPDNPDDLASVKLAALSPTSFAGYRFAEFELKAQGVELPQEILFADSGEEAIDRFVAGEFDALIGWGAAKGATEGTGEKSGTLQLIETNYKDGKSAFNIIWNSSAIPNRPHVIRKSLAVEAKSLLREVLTRLYDSDPVAYDSIEPVFGGGFEIARHGQFLPIIEYIKSLENQETAEITEPGN